ncbi:hypothetical protein CONPUDRAFT_72825 [Coniophora puteana RWD-64-598 SS2]|uniref:Uncharacterized protein n=1 Tax=Coniophora puteana (strain RWD-64-598) TaxID=741705 RepID=A0A5M3MPE8_CONPW|nr:uncharacterized protein CONPUDRAFT_72825 [Coniophora puteana RWD-64-598 SS2]EIW80983.1 hypothetical protein CONPUDRAFT_72825 [Coniophora puteana RWD-64-598 SS2]
MSSNQDPGSSSDTPLDDPTYLQSPLHTLADSFKLGSHVDVPSLLDAYDTFVHRVKSQAQGFQERLGEIPAAKQIRQQSSDVIQALRRDIGLAHYDPIGNLATCGSPESRLLSEDCLKAAKEASLICQRALCLWHIVIHFRAISEQFSGNNYSCHTTPFLTSICLAHDILSVLDDVIKIYLCEALPALNGRKIQSLAICSIHLQQLPHGLLQSKQRDIVEVTKCALSSGESTKFFDGIKVMCHLLDHYDTIFGPSVVELLCFMRKLSSDSLETRSRAAVAMAKLAQCLSSSRTSIARTDDVATFILSLSTSPQAKTSPLESSLCLFEIIQHTINTSKEIFPGNCPTWAVSVLASLIVLSGRKLFFHGAAMKFVFHSLGSVEAHKHPTIRAFHAPLWKCLVWAFMDLVHSSQTDLEVLESAFSAVNQVHRAGVGASLVMSLLDVSSCYGAWSTAKAFRVLEDMITSDSKHVQRDAVRLLKLMTGSKGPSSSDTLQCSSRKPTPLITNALLDGSLVQVEWVALPKLVKALPRTNLGHMRRFFLQELFCHLDSLLLLWSLCVDPTSDTKLQPDVVEIWKNLLVIESEKRACTVARASLVLVQFLPSASKFSKGLSLDGQIRCLKIISQLWQALRGVCAVLAVAAAAKPLLASLLVQKFQLEDEEALYLWSFLCEELARAIEPSATAVVAGEISSSSTEKRLWGVAANYVLSSDNHLALWDIVELLELPLRSDWTMVDLELDAWKCCLKHAIHLADITAVGAMQVVNHLIHGWGDRHETTNSLVMVAIILQVPEVEAIKLWFEDEHEILSENDYNHVVVTFYCEILGRLQLHPLSIKVLEDIGPFLAAGFVRIPEPALAPIAFEQFGELPTEESRSLSTSFLQKFKDV